MGLIGAVGKGVWKTAKGAGRMASSAVIGAADATRIGRISRLDPIRESAQKGLRGVGYHLARGTSEIVNKGVPATAQAAILGARGFNSFATRPTRPGHEGNVFGRSLQPWAVASLALLTLTGGANMANQLSAMSSVEYEPRTDPTMLGNYEMGYHRTRPKEGENPMFVQDASHNYSNMGATGDLAFALHKNRHG